MRLLVVEDDPGIVQFVSQGLREAGYAVDGVAPMRRLSRPFGAVASILAPESTPRPGGVAWRMPMTTLEERLIPPPLHVVARDLGTGAVTVQARLATAAARCPGCARRSARVRSTYQRTVADLPWGARIIRICVTVRRFACANPDCPRRIFAESLGSLAPRYARRSGRLARALTTVAFALGGEAGSRLAHPNWLRVALITAAGALELWIAAKRFGTADHPARGERDVST